ncbi:hypothetical protein [Vibrio barjaei]|uniref:hypothetical protein n=1 Tax=Vibrio barjaei TaxID=1676683 RepID=UPI0022853224|nr:hypothetical protein [Vibrio barjaei]MCY9874022.1 hypothetical protein [Vibrio barjaei]
MNQPINPNQAPQNETQEDQVEQTVDVDTSSVAYASAEACETILENANTKFVIRS